MPFGGREGWRGMGTVQPDRSGLLGLKLSEPCLLDLTDTNRICIFVVALSDDRTTWVPSINLLSTNITTFLSQEALHEHLMIHTLLLAN